MTLQDRLTDLVLPIVAQRGLELFDLVYAGGTLTVMVQRPEAGSAGEGAGAGVDVDVITDVSRAISRALDDADPISGAYSLEVSTPGLERPLRTPAHFAGAVGEVVSVKTTADVDGPRRIKGVLVASSDDDVTVRPDDGTDERTIRLADIDKARTVFEWGPTPKQGQPKSGPAKDKPTSGRAKDKPTSGPSKGRSKAGSTSAAKNATTGKKNATTGKPNPASKKVTSS